VAIEHLATSPAGQSHEIALATYAAREPTVREGMPKLVGMKSVAKPFLPASLTNDLRDPAVG
jgi:hypothetical protein